MQVEFLLHQSSCGTKKTRDRSLFEQDLQWHQSEGRTPGSLLSYITRDGSALAGLSGSVIGTIFSITINLVAAIILTNIIAWKVALVCLALVPVLLGSGLMELRVLSRFEERHEKTFGPLDKTLLIQSQEPMFQSLLPHLTCQRTRR